MANERIPTEAEIIACTLLAQTRALHPVLAAWEDKITADPTYQERLDDAAPALIAAIEAEGYSATFGDEVRRGLADSIANHKALPAQHPDSIHPLPRAEHARDEAVMLLASAVIAHRRRGGQPGEYTTPIMGMGAPLVNVTTSLAAAVCEYVERIKNYYASRLREAGVR